MNSDKYSHALPVGFFAGVLAAVTLALIWASMIYPPAQQAPAERAAPATSMNQASASAEPALRSAPGL